MWILSLAPASLTDFHWLFSVPSSKCCISTSDRLWPLPSMSIPVYYVPASHCLMMDTDTDTVECLQLLSLCTMYCDIGRLGSGKFWLLAAHHSSGDWSVCHVQMKNAYSAGWWSCAVGTLLLPHELKTRLDWDCLQYFVTKAISNMAQLNLLLEYVAADNGSYMSFIGQEPAQNGQAGCRALETGYWTEAYVCEVLLSWIHVT